MYSRSPRFRPWPKRLWQWWARKNVCQSGPDASGRQAILSNAQGEIQSQAELEDLVRHADKDRLLKDDEAQTLVQTLAEAREDREKGRAFVLRRVEAEREYELQKLDLGHRYGLSHERLSFEVAAARREMEGQWELELRRVDLEIGQERRLAQFRRDQESEEQDVGNRYRVEKARTAAAISDIEREQDEQDPDASGHGAGVVPGLQGSKAGRRNSP